MNSQLKKAIYVFNVSLFIILVNSVLCCQNPILSWTEEQLILSKFRDLDVVEPHISAHPDNPDMMLIAAILIQDDNNPYESGKLISYTTDNRGTSWKEYTHNYFGYDPWTTITSSGIKEIAWLGTESQFIHAFPVQFIRFDSRKKTWNSAYQTINGNHDGAKIISYSNREYFATVQFNEQMGADVTVYQNGEDNKYKEIVRIPGNQTRYNFCQPAMVNDSILIIPVSEYLNKIWVYRYNVRSEKLSGRVLVSVNPGGAKGYMQLVADNSADSPNRGNLYFLRALGAHDEVNGVWLNISTDGGYTWSRDTRIDNFPEGHQRKANIPCIAINDKGNIGISWIDQAGESEFYATYFTYSQDGGRIFSNPLCVSSGYSLPAGSQLREVEKKFPAGGHYMGLCTRADDHFQLVWSANNIGNYKLYTCSVGVQAR